jgi:hypothetical protein
VAWDDGRDFEDDVTKEMVVDWVERFADLAGIKVVSTSSAGLLARVVQDFHGHVKGTKATTRARDAAGMDA